MSKFSNIETYIVNRYITKDDYLFLEVENVNVNMLKDVVVEYCKNNEIGEVGKGDDISLTLALALNALNKVVWSEIVEANKNLFEE